MLSFTIVTPVLNGARFLKEAISSVRAQRCTHVEYIVRDGGSHDDSIRIIEGSRDIVTRFASERDGGMYSALAKGFEGATGDIFGWINADDLLMPWCLNVVSRYFEAFPECEWVTGVPTMFDESGDMVWTAAISPQYHRSWIAKGWYSACGLGAIQQESTFFRRGLYERVGGIRPEFKLAGDFDLWRRFALHAKLHQLGCVVAGFRLHGANLSADLDAYLREAKATRIPLGTLLGSMFSFVSICWGRALRRRRFKDVCIPGAIGTNKL
jgi:glycosyltransferase involved in cell wall biosynthesis